MGQRLKLFVIVLTMLFVPIILNIVLGSCNPLDCIDVVGDPRDWLGFYGSYMGGCLTALIGFITLARDEKSNKLQIQISHKEHYVKELEGRLAECISLFDYSRVGIISMYLDDKSMYSMVIKDMDTYLNKVTSTANAWCTIYGSSQQQEVKDFLEAYNKCVRQLISAINEVTKLIVSLKIAEGDAKDQIINSINGIVKKSDDYQAEYLLPLFNCANSWIASEKELLEVLRNEL